MSEPNDVQRLVEAARAIEKSGVLRVLGGRLADELHFARASVERRQWVEAVPFGQSLHEFHNCIVAQPHATGGEAELIANWNRWREISSTGRAEAGDALARALAEAREDRSALVRHIMELQRALKDSATRQREEGS